jgi:hypothetical protein
MHLCSVNDFSTKNTKDILGNLALHGSGKHVYPAIRHQQEAPVSLRGGGAEMTLLGAWRTISAHLPDLQENQECPYEQSAWLGAEGVHSK